ncbi:MAG: hypothetical protein VB078_05385 [Clostridiaceae bacterium]|nr:hypothetical protein [Clostridiaceae bacterium]
MASFTRNSDTALLKLPDCDGLLENGKCRWLNVSKCTGFKCSYYKKTNSFEKAQERLRSLDKATQKHIAQKYYGGSCPWANTEANSRR